MKNRMILIYLTMAVFLCLTSCGDDKTTNPDSNTAPNAFFSVDPMSGDTTTIFYVDASSSDDNQDPSSVLQVRWDWENDGAYDGGWTTTKCTGS